MNQIDVLNRLANDPAVLSRMAPGMSSVDMSGFFLRPGNFMLGDERGAALFAMISPGVYEGHYMFPHLIGTRKRIQGETRPIDKCRAFIDTVFTDHYADAIVGHTPVEDRAARALSRALGFTRQGTSVSPMGRSCVDFVLERHQWATLSGASSGA